MHAGVNVYSVHFENDINLVNNIGKLSIIFPFNSFSPLNCIDELWCFPLDNINRQHV